MDVMESGRTVIYRGGFVAACRAEVIRSAASWRRVDGHSLGDLGGNERERGTKGALMILETADRESARLREAIVNCWSVMKRELRRFRSQAVERRPGSRLERITF